MVMPKTLEPDLKTLIIGNVRIIDSKKYALIRIYTIKLISEWGYSYAPTIAVTMAIGLKSDKEGYDPCLTWYEAIVALQYSMCKQNTQNKLIYFNIVI